MIIDSHCHLEYEPLSKNLDDVVDRAFYERAAPRLVRRRISTDNFIRVPRVHPHARHEKAQFDARHRQVRFQAEGVLDERRAAGVGRGSKSILGVGRA